MAATRPRSITFRLHHRGRPHMALLIDGDHYGMTRRFHVEADEVVDSGRNTMSFKNLVIFVGPVP